MSNYNPEIEGILEIQEEKYAVNPEMIINYEVTDTFLGELNPLLHAHPDGIYREIMVPELMTLLEDKPHTKQALLIFQLYNQF